MLKLEELANAFELEINDFLDKKNLSFVRFKIFSDLGKFKKAKKIDNDVTYYINACLTEDGSDVKVLSQGNKMAVINLNFEFAVPTQSPRYLTTPADFTGSYYYPTLIRETIEEYFSLKKQDSVAGQFGDINFGFLNTGVLDVSVGLGEHITYNSYIAYNFVEDGLNSSIFSINIDGEPLAFESAVPNRNSQLQTDISSDNANYISKNIVTSSAFAIDVTIPALNNALGQEFLDCLFNGKPNVAHFVDITIKKSLSDQIMYSYLCLVNDINLSLVDKKIAGHTLSIIEARDDLEMYDFPNGYSVYRITALDKTQNINFEPKTRCFCKGRFYNPDSWVTITPDELNEDGITYLVVKALTFSYIDEVNCTFYKVT